uniref:Uncharacterized protein n=1 Tax=Noccaea caerulescens TaxID=107243 RepID=A0A1J3DVF0_NOCCA
MVEMITMMMKKARSIMIQKKEINLKLEVKFQTNLNALNMKHLLVLNEKRGKYDGIRISNSTSGEEGFMELLSSDRRRKSRKHKKRGTSHGSKKEVAPEILKMFREALFLHIHGRDIEALPIIAEVIKQSPAYREALKIAANMQDLCLNARVGVNEQQAP